MAKKSMSVEEYLSRKRRKQFAHLIALEGLPTPELPKTRSMTRTEQLAEGRSLPDIEPHPSELLTALLADPEE